MRSLYSILFPTSHSGKIKLNKEQEMSMKTLTENTNTCNSDMTEIEYTIKTGRSLEVDKLKSAIAWAIIWIIIWIIIRMLPDF